MKTYLVFHIVGYNNKLVDNEQLSDKVVIRLIDKNIDSAMERAKKIISRNYYFLAEVVEYRDK